MSEKWHPTFQMTVTGLRLELTSRTSGDDIMGGHSRDFREHVGTSFAVADLNVAPADALTETFRGGTPMVTLQINGEAKAIDAPADMPLLWVLRDMLALTGTKFGCGIAQCGACTVHVDGEAVRSCMLPIGAIGSRAITTIEGVGATAAGAKAQKAWLALEVVQCGYCQSGQIMAAAALLAATPNPDDSDIDAAMAGNICRCGTYVRIREAIKQAARSV